MRERRAECLIVRRSFLLFVKLGEEKDWVEVEVEVEAAGFEGVGGRGREIRPEPDFEEVFERIEGRFFGAVGAWVC